MGEDGELLFLYQEGSEYWKQNPFKPKILHYLNVGKEEKLYARFTILPNVNGQKVNSFPQMNKHLFLSIKVFVSLFQYTLGKTFASREEQGEFIFLDHEATSKESSCCQIFVDRNKFFIYIIENVNFR